MINTYLSIRQTYGQIGIQTQSAELDIQSPRGELSIRQSPAEMKIRSPRGSLQIDSSDAWAALAQGGDLRWNQFIYSQEPAIALQAIGKIVEDGKRMAQITNHRNAFADLARGAMNRTNPVRYAERASNMNVHVQYEQRTPEIDIQPVKPKVRYTPHSPEFHYARGNVDISMRQMYAIDIQVKERGEGLD